MKKALIIGISGQDGSLLADYLINNKNYEVYGTTRNIKATNFENLRKLNIYEKIKILETNLDNIDQVISILIKVNPSEIYNLSGQTSVAKSFEIPLLTYNDITTTYILLEAIRVYDLKIKFFNAGSTDCFGEAAYPANEETKFNPISPYGVSKSSSFNIVKNYREVYGVYACSGILSNHESIFRKNHFITTKIIDAIFNIANRNQKYLEIGNINIYRDWGWANEYVEAIYLLMQQENKPKDYIIATGQTISLEEFISIAFSIYNLDYAKYIKIDNNLIRKQDISKTFLDVSKINSEIKWVAKMKVKDVILRLSKNKII